MVDTPGIETIAEEAAVAGASRLAIVTSPSKDEVMRHFDEFPEHVEILHDRGKEEQAAKVQRAAEIIHLGAVTQEKPLGLGHAVGLAESVLDDDEDCFAGMLPDDVIEPTAAMSEMIRVRQDHGGSVLLAAEVDPALVSNYGVLDIERTADVRVKRLWAW